MKQISSTLGMRDLKGAAPGYIYPGTYLVGVENSKLGNVMVVTDRDYTSDGVVLKICDAISMKPAGTVMQDRLDSTTYKAVMDGVTFSVQYEDSTGQTHGIVLSGQMNRDAQKRVSKYGDLVKSGRMTVIQPGLGPTGTSMIRTTTATSSMGGGTSISSTGEHVDDLDEASLKEPMDPPNLIASKTEDGYHMPVLDIDLPIKVMPSSTPGHSHLFIEKPMAEEDYFDFLDVLVVAGLVEAGYAAASRARGASFARIEV
jgi:hypothetical protein